MTIVTLATITILETLRRRVIAIVGVASLALVGAVGWGFHRLSEAIVQPIAAIGTEAVLTILLAFAFSVVLAVGSSFLAAPAIASDLESGVALALLPRPLSRSAYVLGKWLGLASLVAVYAFAFGALAFAAIDVGSGYRAPHEIAALFFLVAQSLALFTLALALSTRLAPIAAGIVAVGFFGIAWIAGITAAIARALNADALAHFATFTGLVIPTDGLWRGAVYALTPAAMLVAQDTIGQRGLNPFGVNEPPPTAFLIWSVVWIVAVLASAVASMRTRDV
jgi:ABC-type transport system involved in multi-copper enzyme maturation permease subunit